MQPRSASYYLEVDEDISVFCQEVWFWLLTIYGDVTLQQEEARCVTTLLAAQPSLCYRTSAVFQLDLGSYVNYTVLGAIMV